ncbi:hypothetical protein M8818_004795 [Zalaria obscura]|uniref:Uncharacterized protein n=1 Tax=Zalaria obscura TaxID=2024903 RepID=A0ACC3SAK3_9PEZI
MIDHAGSFTLLAGIAAENPPVCVTGLDAVQDAYQTSVFAQPEESDFRAWISATTRSAGQPGQVRRCVQCAFTAQQPRSATTDCLYDTVAYV